MIEVKKKLKLAILLAPIIISSVMLSGLLIILHYKNASAQLPDNSTLIWPISGSSQPDTDLISSPFGPRWQASQARYDYHSGVDIASPINTPIHVITDGVVTEVGWLSPDSGLTVIVSHTLAGYNSAYLHLNSANVTVGQPVNQGDVIGFVGDSGTTDFMHLHLEIRLGSHGYPRNTRNPFGYLPYSDTNTPGIEIVSLTYDPIYSPTVTLRITSPRTELDVNQIRVTLQDKVTGQVIDDQPVDFNLRLHTGEDDLDQDGIKLTPSHFSTETLEYELGAYFYQISGLDSFTMTAQVTDLSGHVAAAVAAVEDTMPPDPITDLRAYRLGDGSVDLVWTAPGDNGSHGTAASYDFRYDTSPIDSFSWASAIPIDNPPLPVVAGNRQVWNIPGSWPGNFYFAVRSSDEEHNTSLLSNSAQALWRILLPIVVR